MGSRTPVSGGRPRTPCGSRRLETADARRMCGARWCNVSPTDRTVTTGSGSTGLEIGVGLAGRQARRLCIRLDCTA